MLEMFDLRLYYDYDKNAMVRKLAGLHFFLFVLRFRFNVLNEPQEQLLLMEFVYQLTNDNANRL